MASLSRFTDAAGVASSSWLYSGRSSIRSCVNENSAGASLTIAVASLRLNDALRRLPTMTTIWNWLMSITMGG